MNLEKELKGSVKISVCGLNTERFINICTNNKILIWNLKREKDTILYARVSIKDFKKLKNVCKKSQCKMKINRKKGVPFILNKYKKRKIFVGLLIFIIVGIIALSNFILLGFLLKRVETAPVDVNVAV